MSENDWYATYPGPLDFNFNYRKLMDNSPDGIGSKQTGAPIRVAIIGAGAAGLTAAHELVRSGVDVDVFEATGRYGGRFWTKTLGDNQYTTQEAGAMRMPPFIAEEKDKPDNDDRQDQVYKGCSILSYYLQKYKISTAEFPNPGSNVADTGIYYEHGKGCSNGDNTPAKMLEWKKEQTEPPSHEIKAVKKKWDDFRCMVQKFVSKHYHTERWPGMWQSIVREYYQYTFRDVVLMKASDGNADDPSKWGGLGMTEDEARIFYVVGAGDGGWGSFFNLSFLYVLRTFVGGYGTGLQVIEGLFNADKEHAKGPEYGKTIRDSIGNVIPNPKYLGTSTITDCLLFGALKEGEETSLFNKFSDTADLNHLFLNAPICEIRKNDNKKISLKVKTGLAAGAREYLRGDKPRHQEDMMIDDADDTRSEVTYDAVILTVPTHQIGTEIRIEGFDNAQWPPKLETYLSQAHWEPCCKVFVDLKKPYWEQDDCKIPQCISSDTFLHDIYGVKVDKGGDEQTGTLLLSYTWWRDATKLVGYEDQELINMAVAEADRMLASCENLKNDEGVSPTISEFVKTDEHGNFKGWVHHWELQKTYKGAARLYDQKTWENTRLPMTYNQEYSERSGLYFAGEAYHVDAGWVEPSFRSAIDAVLRILNTTNGYKLKTGGDPVFDFYVHYPKYKVDFDPSKKQGEKRDLEDSPEEPSASGSGQKRQK